MADGKRDFHWRRGVEFFGCDKLGVLRIFESGVEMKLTVEMRLTLGHFKFCQHIGANARVFRLSLQSTCMSSGVAQVESTLCMA